MFTSDRKHQRKLGSSADCMPTELAFADDLKCEHGWTAGVCNDAIIKQLLGWRFSNQHGNKSQSWLGLVRWHASCKLELWVIGRGWLWLVAQYCSKVRDRDSYCGSAV